VLSIEPMFDFAIRINLINDPICVLSDSSSENNNFIVLAHFMQKFFAIGPHKEVRVRPVVNIVDQRFV